MTKHVRFVAIISDELNDKLMRQCVDEFLSHHPEFKGYRITRTFMLQKIVDYYLEQ
jgi:hypothetical protein